MTNPQAEELNTIIKEKSQTVYELLSKKGKEIFFPKKGILGQSADARTKKINATIGIANEDDGTPMRLKIIEERLKIEPKRAFTYSPSYGNLELRQKWKELMIKKNPNITTEISTPVATIALTHGLYMAAYMFMDPNDEVIIPDYYWGNYTLIFKNAFDAKIVTFQTFVNGKFNTEGLKEKIKLSKKPIVLLNFPNNPTGYSPTIEEANEIANILKEEAKHKKILVIYDDAYFGLVYKDNIFTESVFALTYNLDENILSIKLDGATKEDYVWGFRVGFLTYGIKGGDKKLYAALEDKTAGAVRGNVSNVSNLSQSLVFDALNHEKYNHEKLQKYDILKERFVEVEKILEDEKYLKHFYALPYNSGYFMCIALRDLEAEIVRQKLLEKYDTGVIALGKDIRIAFSGVPKKFLKELFDNIYNACEDLSK
jgi:aspartate/methionine/tyrosine aminotransferase